MKLLIVFISVSFLVGFTSRNLHQDMQVEWKAGIFESSDCINDGQHGGYQAEMQICNEYNLVKDASEVPIHVGVNFGLEYVVVPQISGSCFEETRVLIHPPITQPDGTITTHYSRSYKVGNCPEGIPVGPDMFTWFIEHEWEAVKGEWVFKVLVEGEQVISKKFTTY